MAEDQWLKDIVSEIKGKDHVAAIARKAREHRAHIIATKGPIFWTAFIQFIQKYIDEMKAEFGDDPTASKISFQPNQSPRIGFIKEAFPYASFSANPNFNGQPNQIMYLSINPEYPDGTHVDAKSMPSQFEIAGDDIILQLNGDTFSNPDEAVRFIFKKLFTI